MKARNPWQLQQEPAVLAVLAARHVDADSTTALPLSSLDLVFCH